MDTVHYIEHWVWKGQDIFTRVYRQAERYTAELVLDILDKVLRPCARRVFDRGRS